MKRIYTPLYPNEQVAAAFSDYALSHSTKLPKHISDHHAWGARSQESELHDSSSASIISNLVRKGHGCEEKYVLLSFEQHHVPLLKRYSRLTLYFLAGADFFPFHLKSLGGLAPMK
jgi:hypothetical protein